MPFITATAYRHWIEGPTWGARVWRTLAAGIEVPVGWYVARRNADYDCGRRTIHLVDAPVISVGNLTVGGTGKTPFVAWLAEWLQTRQIPTTLISRGYGRRDDGPNDEALELAWRLPHVPHLQNADRVAAAEQALRHDPRQVLLLDDAFQHRRIARDLDIVLLDGLDPWGGGHLLPRGLLREPASSLCRAQVVALSRADAVVDETRAALRQEVARHAPEADWVEVAHRPSGWRSTLGTQLPLAELAGRRAAAFCGIGNPAGFRHTLAAAGVEVVGLRAFPDHCAYAAAEVRGIQQWVKSLEVDVVVCTLKDLVKLPYQELAGRPLWGLSIDLAILSGQEHLEGWLEAIAAKWQELTPPTA
jgi:tetraacyldisaccharide 4'-kinase